VTQIFVRFATGQVGNIFIYVQRKILVNFSSHVSDAFLYVDKSFDILINEGSRKAIFYINMTRTAIIQLCHIDYERILSRGRCGDGRFGSGRC